MYTDYLSIFLPFSLISSTSALYFFSHRLWIYLLNLSQSFSLSFFLTFVHVITGLFVWGGAVVWVCNCKSPVYILDMNLLSDICFPNIFSYFLSCLFLDSVLTIKYKSFKFILMKSSLSISLLMIILSVSTLNFFMAT